MSKHHNHINDISEELEILIEAEEKQVAHFNAVPTRLHDGYFHPVPTGFVAPVCDVNSRIIPTDKIMVTDLGAVKLIGVNYVDSNGVIITDTNQLINYVDSEFLTGAPPLFCPDVLCDNAVILLEDAFFHATKGTAREFRVLEPNAVRLGMTLPELDSAAQELVLKGLAVRNAVHYNLVSKV